MNEYMKELTSANDKLNQMTQQQTDLKKDAVEVGEATT